ncbi:MAG TPA: glycosyltransferase family 2 protein [Candidatus Saccharimonadales bacterium]|nr:glycosyltransferase family 2 protein [Candidatus Saccharimonadales bacterium]
MGPPIELIIPAHNEELHIGTTLRSLHAQELVGTDERYAVTVVANACSDQTAERAEETISTLTPRPELTYSVVEEATPGKNNAINSRLQKSDSKYFMYMDADVVLSGRSLRRIAERLRRQGIMVSGALTRTVIPAEITTTGFGRLLRTWQLRHEIVQKPAAPTGRMMAFNREAVRSLPTKTDVAEDRYVTLSVSRNFGRQAVCPTVGAYVYPNAPRTPEDFIAQQGRYVAGAEFLFRQYPVLRKVFKDIQAVQRREHPPMPRKEVYKELTRRALVEQIEPDRVRELYELDEVIKTEAKKMLNDDVLALGGRWTPIRSTKIPAHIKSVLVT